MRGIFILVAIFNSSLLYSQSIPPYNPKSTTKTYSHPDNPNYWRNKLPIEGYWQQDVAYEIKAEINAERDLISASATLFYSNNSPDTLYELFFHLYQNAFTPDSYYDKLQKENGRKNRYGKYESQGLGTVVSNLKVRGSSVKTELDNTILRVILERPILPGEMTDISMDFKTYFDDGGNVRRRMKVFDSYGSRHYDGVHWYPRICVYDRKFGWTTDQHLGKEFYGDFGVFDVELTFPESYVVGATGFLVNRSDVLPTALRQKLDIKNFKDKAWNSAPSIITPYDSSKKKTWVYHAENVHDFAFTADPNYRIGEAEWNGIKCYALCQEPHASGWQNAAEYTSKIIKTFSEDFGQYVYHKMIVADARDGMEYPMLTLDGGADPGYRGLLTHEVGHNWFFGQVGNNETYRASLDEGFTQFLTAWGLERIDGDTAVQRPYKNWYLRKFKKPGKVRYNSVYYSYLRDALRGDDTRLNTHSDHFGGLRHGGGYHLVYYKTATMLYNLQYVLGDSLFQAAMKNYFSTWRIAHPYFEDFRNSIIQFTQVDLNWFFDQWLESTSEIDYALSGIKRMSKDPVYEITIQRKGEMQMPLDLEITDQNDNIYQFHIPNTWFEKEGEAEVLDRWIGWGQLQPSYSTEIKLDAPIKSVTIDPEAAMADVRKMNNRSTDRLSVDFDHGLYNRPSFDQYELFVRPDLWYNGYDGLKIGFNINGDYADYLHKFHLSVWANNRIGQFQDYFSAEDINNQDPISYNLIYEHPLDNVIKGSSIKVESRFLDGLMRERISYKIPLLNQRTGIELSATSLYRPNDFDLNYLIYQDQWNADSWNNFAELKLSHEYFYPFGRGKIDLTGRSSALFSDYEYSFLRLDVRNDNRITRKLNFKTRIFAQIGSGSSWAPESQVYLAGASPEEMMENKYMRSIGFFPYDFYNYGSALNHLQFGGGMNIRAFNGYFAPYTNDEGIVGLGYRGVHALSGSGELEFNRLIWNPRGKINRYLNLSTYLFADAGILLQDFDQIDYFEELVRMDAGIGAALTIKKFWVLEKTKPLTIRADFPLLVNRLPAGQSEFFDFRWLIGVQRSF